MNVMPILQIARPRRRRRRALSLLELIIATSMLAMLLTSIGSEYWPRSAEGRILCLLLSLYGFAVLGYVTATLATFFIGRDAENEEAELAGAKSIDALRAEIAALRAEIRDQANSRESQKIK